MRPVAAVLAVVLAGCGEEPDPVDDCIVDLASRATRDDPAAHIVLGTGYDSFIELNDEDQILLIHGPQGGYHMLLNVRMYGMEPGRPDDFTGGAPMTLLSITDEAGNRLDHLICAFTYPYVATDTDGFELYSAQSLIIDNALVPSIYGQRVHAEAHVLDRSGRYGSDEAWAIVTMAPEPAVRPETVVEPALRQ